MRYGELIKDTFEIVRRNRFLWFFGFFAGGSSFNFSYSNASGRGDGSGPAAGAGADPLDPGILIAIVVGAVLLIALFIVLSVVSHGGLADSVAAIQRGEPRGFRSTWRAGRARFWRVLGLGVLLFLLALALLLAVALPLAGLVAGTFALTEALLARVLAGVGVFILAFVALVLILIPLWIVAQFALRALVLDGERITDSIRAGWRLLRRNFGRSLLLFLILLGIGLAATLAIFLAVFVLAAPTIVLLIIGSSAATAVAIVTGVIVVPLFVVAVGALGAFNHGFWTLAYTRLEAAPTPPA